MRSRSRVKRQRSSRWRRRLECESLEARQLLAGDPILDGQPLMISEIVAESSSSLTTRTRVRVVQPFEGLADSPDWLELLNISSQPIDLGGLHLTDDAADPNKWEFPPGTSLDAGAFLVVFASGQDIRDPSLDELGYLHTNFRLSGDGDYLALTDRDGSVIHEYVPAYPPQRVDVSYSVPMTRRTLLGPDAPLEFLLPADNSLADRWQQPGFTDPGLVRSDAGSPIGFDRGGGTAEPGETVGAEPIDRSSVDFSRGSIVVLESTPFTAAGRVVEWSFYAEAQRAVTPLVLRAAGDEFQIVGVGRTRTSDGSGTQSFEFELQSGSDEVEASGYYFGFKDGDNLTDDPGAVVWGRTSEARVRRYNGPQSGNVVSGQTLSRGGSFDRAYSIQATTRARLAGPIRTDVDAIMSNATSLYVRYPFTVEQRDALKSLSLEVRYEDGFVAYLNGVEVARRNVPADVQFNSTASADRLLKDANRFEQINISRFIGALTVGENILALQGLDDGRGGEFLLDARLVGIDIPSAAGAGFAAQPTPGLPNGEVLAGFVAPTLFSHERGFYEQPFTLTLSAPGTPGAAIYFTRDGSDPTPDNPAATRYQQPLEIAATTIFRAAGYQDGLLPSLPQTHTFLFPADIVAQTTLQPAVAQDPVWGPQLPDSLRALPTISLVTADTIAVTGEYPTSVELIYPDGDPGVQVDAGIEVYGGTAVSFPKRSMRISFKNVYGPASFAYDVFDDAVGANEFDQLLLRAGSHDTPFWNGGAGVGSYIRNRWTTDRQLEMGQPAPRSRFVQVYLNGVYWGQYNLTERPNGGFMAANFGGSKDDYDVLNAGRVVDGDLEAWNQLLDALDDGYDQVKQYLDVVNYADYILLQWFGGNTIDWRSESNWMAARRRQPGAGFQFFGWDSDIVLRMGADADIVNYGGPGFLWTLNGGVQQYPEFLRLLAERAQRYFFDDGMFTPAQLRRQIDELAEETRTSVIAETARWGSSIYTPATWESAIQWIKDTYAPENGPSRAEIVIEQMRQAGYFPLVDQPQLIQDGQPLVNDELSAGAQLSMAATPGDIYYTLDGSDPRQAAPTVDYTTLVGTTSPARVLIPTDGTLRDDWQTPEFDDSGWTGGTNGVGYDSTQDLLPWVDLNVQAQMEGINSTAYVRLPFQVDDPSQFDTLQLALQYDDGFVAYLNGVEVARRNAPASVTWNSRASVAHANVEAIEFERFNLTRVTHLLRPGDNVLAIHALNSEPNNVDFLITPVLRAGKVTDAGISPTAIRFTGAITVPTEAKIKARTVWHDEWSTLREAAVPTEPFPLRVSEIMYHPADATDLERAAGFGDADDFEFIELVNISDAPLDLAGVRLAQVDVGGQTEGLAFDFASGTISQLAPGQRVVVVEDLDAFRFRYGSQLPVAGQWSGGLSNDSEQITVIVGDQTLQQFTYDDAWYPSTDGQGASLEIKDVRGADLTLWNQRDGWQPSAAAGGTPGRGSDPQPIGDVNHDGVFNSADLLAVLQAAEFEDDVQGNSSYEEGDWNGDGDFTTADLVFAFQQGNFLDDGPP